MSFESIMCSDHIRILNYIDRIFLVGSTHDVHLKDGAHLRQGTFLCIWTCLLRHCGNWPKSPYHGTKLHPRKERRLVPEVNPEVCIEC